MRRSGSSQTLSSTPREACSPDVGRTVEFWFRSVGLAAADGAIAAVVGATNQAGAGHLDDREA